jgi:hypothetical protein
MSDEKDAKAFITVGSMICGNDCCSCTVVTTVSEEVAVTGNSSNGNIRNRISTNSDCST